MKRALVTGGSGAIGAAVCRQLARDGCQVIVHANKNLEHARQLAEEIIANGGAAAAVAFDITDAQATKAALDNLLADGAIQIIVNNAGIHDDAVMPGMRPEQWTSVIDVTLNGFFNVTQPLLMPMISKRWGRIINLSSLAAVMGNRGQVNYAAAKAGLHGATKSLALKSPAVASPSMPWHREFIVSPMTEPAFPKEAINSMVPMKRAGRPEEVADLIAFLASDRAAYISGQIISINGAMA